MDRTGKIIVALSIVLLVVWTVFNQREMQKASAARAVIAEEQRQKEAIAAAEAPAPAPAVAPLGTPAAVAATVAAPTVPAQTETLSNSKVAYTFTNLGGGLERAVLLNHEAEAGKRMVINEFGNFPIGGVTEDPDQPTNRPFTAVRDGSSITYTALDEKKLELKKKFTITQTDGDPDEHTVLLEVTYTNRGSQPIDFADYFIHTGSAAPVHQSDLPIYTGLRASKGSFHDVNWFASSGFLGIGASNRPTFSEEHADIAWLGVTNQYFSTIISPQLAAPDVASQAKQRGTKVWARRFDVTDAEWEQSGRSRDGGGTRHAIHAALGMPGFKLDPGQSAMQSFLIYAGPGEYSRLKKLGSTEEEIMNFGMFGIVSKTLLNGLNILHSFFNSYAAAIIVLTLVIKSLLWPLQNKATTSMKRMSLLQPKMIELKEKYSDNPARMNEETLKLYKDYGVNPLSGCLPMLIQIPIFFGFYNMLGKAVELRNSHFLWVQDLSQPDTIFHLASIPVNPLPLVMAGTMFWQMAISPKSGDAMQQRMFMFMPLIFVFFCYNYASALALYWTVQNLFSVAQLYVTRNQAPPELVKVAAPRKK